MGNTDASTKLLGFKYQELVALHKCLDAEDYSTVYLECHGDISDGSQSIEVKHSIDSEKKLINTHIDFWKTLFNLLSNIEKYLTYNSFIIHTTANITDESIFENWNDLSVCAKKEKVLSVTPNNTIRKYIEKVRATKNKDLEDILSKLKIHSGQPSAKDYYQKELLDHAAIRNVLPVEDRESFLISLFGLVSIELVKGTDYTWEINIENFRDGFRHYLNQYKLEELIFPIAKPSTSEAQSNYRFIEELRSIGYDSKITLALNDYLRASESQFRMVAKRPLLIKDLDYFDQEIMEELEDAKLTQNERLKYIKSPDLEKLSKEFFDDCVQGMKNKTHIPGVIGVKSYYPKGRIHNQVEENIHFSWKLIDSYES